MNVMCYECDVGIVWLNCEVIVIIIMTNNPLNSNINPTSPLVMWIFRLSDQIQTAMDRVHWTSKTILWKNTPFIFIIIIALNSQQASIDKAFIRIH